MADPAAITVWSSGLFVVPAALAAVSRDWQVAAGSVLVLLTSLAYHATSRRCLRTVDMTAAFTCMSYFMFVRASLTARYAVAAASLWQRRIAMYGILL